MLHDFFGLAAYLLFLVVAFVNGNDHHLQRCDAGRQHQPVIIAMRHHERTYQAGAHTPTGSPYIFLLVFLTQEFYFKSFSEILPEEMRSASLERLAILHQCFNTISVFSARKSFTRRFNSPHYGKGHIFFREFSINFQHFFCFLHCFLCSGMRGMTFLPEKFSRTEEKPCTHFPTHHVGPLVHQDGQVAVTLDPVLVGIPDNGFTGGTHHQFFFQFCLGINNQFSLVIGISLQAVMCYHRAFLGKTFGIFFFSFKKAFGNKEREIGILVTGILEHFVQHITHIFPEGITIRFNDHTSPYG